MVSYPEPDCMRMVKNDYLLNSQNQAKKCQDTYRSNRKTNNKLLIGKFHITHIIRGIKKWRQPVFEAGKVSA